MATGTRRKAPIKPGDKPMDDEHRNILRICREKLVKDMEPAKVLLGMVDPLLFTREDENEIKANDLTRQEQSENLLDLLQRKGAKAYETFKETIQKVHPHLTSVILEAENEELRSELRIERENSASFRKRLATPRTALCQGEQSKEPTERKIPEDVVTILAEVRELRKIMTERETGVQQKEIEECKKIIEQCKQMNIQVQHLLKTEESEKSKQASKREGERSEQRSERETSSDIFSLRAEGNQSCLRCQELEEKVDHLKTELDNQKERLVEDISKNERFTKVDADSLQKIEDLEKENKALVTKNNDLLSKIKTEECETSECDELKAKLNRLSSEIERLQKEDNNSQLKCKTLDEEVNKYKNAVSRAFLPSVSEFSSPTDVLSTLSREGSVKLVATRSSDGPGEATDIFNHSKGKESGTAAKKDSWWCVDLGENYRLVITHYALRHGKKDGEAILQRWKLQGSIDGLMWTDLNASDPSDPLQFRAPFPYFTGRWSVKGEVGAFRYFRILQTGVNSSGKYGIYLSGFELHGVLTKL